MDAMKNFQYKHNSSVTIASTLGKIVLTYKIKAEEKNDILPFLFEGAEYEEPARNERTYFVAALYNRSGATAFLGYGIVPEIAMQSIYTQEALSRLRSENL